jgi:hypothetical protein
LADELLGTLLLELEVVVVPLELEVVGVLLELEVVIDVLLLELAPGSPQPTTPPPALHSAAVSISNTQLPARLQSTFALGLLHPTTPPPAVHSVAVSIPDTQLPAIRHSTLPPPLGEQDGTIDPSGGTHCSAV